MHTIYLLTNTANGKRYVGQTVKTAEARFANHVACARAGRGYLISKAIRKHGPEAFRVHVIETCDTKARADNLERRWIKLHNAKSREHGYNLTDGGEGTVGHKHTTETIAKMRAHRPSEAARAKMSAAARSRSPESNQRGAEKRRGRRMSDQTRARMSAAAPRERPWLRGRKATDETRAKLSESHRGLVRSPESVTKTADAHRGMKRSDGAKANISAGLRAAWANASPEERGRLAAAMANRPNPFAGKKHSDETKAKMRAYWAARRKETNK